MTTTAKPQPAATIRREVTVLAQLALVPGLMTAWLTWNHGPAVATALALAVAAVELSVLAAAVAIKLRRTAAVSPTNDPR